MFFYVEFYEEPDSLASCNTRLIIGNSGADIFLVKKGTGVKRE